MAAGLLLAGQTAIAGTKLLRFPNITKGRVVFTYGGDLWSASSQGGSAVRLTAGPGLEVFARFSPDGSRIAFTGQYGGDDQVYVMPAQGGAPRQLTFYPASGPRVERWGFDNQVYGWTPDGRQILFRSNRDSHVITDARLYTVPQEGGAANALPMPVSGAGALSPDGSQLVYSPLWRDFRSEKRYQGGWANKLYIYDLAAPAFKKITDGTYADRDPMWIGGAIYFNSDRSGTFNLYRFDPGSGTTRALTHATQWDVRWPSSDADGEIVYESDGELHVYDTRTDQDRAISITVPIDATSARAQPVNAADFIEGQAVNPKGGRLAVVARGDVFSVPLEHGVTRNLTQSSDAHEREVAWSTDGKRLAYVSDRSGEDEIYLQAQEGGAPSALTFGSSARYYAPRWSGDDKHVAFADSKNQLIVVDLTTRRRTIVAQDVYDIALDHRWSPDGKYLAYSLNDPSTFSAIYIWSLADGKSHRVTAASFKSTSPAWAPNGELLYFLSAREYAPQMSTIEHAFVTDRQIGVFALALRAKVKNPFGVRNDEPGEGRDAESGDDMEKDKAAAQKKKFAQSLLKIEFDGIESRVIRVPLQADNLSGLVAGDENLLYLRSPPFYYGRDADTKPSVVSYSIKDREAKAIVDDVADWSATADGKHVLVEFTSKEFKYYEVGKAEDAKPVSLAGLATTRVPIVEWREIFAEAWRRYRDYFYVENMHGFDWAALRRKYEPQLAYLAHRADLNYIISEMISELTVQHAYIEGGDLNLPPRPSVALPGARFELDAKSARYRIAAIFAGENEEEHYRSPLTEYGVDVHVGDYVLAINGRELKAGTDPYELLQAPAGLAAEWRVAANPEGKDARLIRYQPIGSESDLLYLAWVMRNRDTVAAASHGRLGYIHIPDMGADGFREFIKWFYPQVRREGLIVDVRDNGGGNISPMILEHLAAPLAGLTYVRNHHAPLTDPAMILVGPKAALVNEDTASDGDSFAYEFKEQHLGPVIGKRTWGGVVGYTDHGPLLDGGSVFVPEYGQASADGQWIIEGHGVDPDIVVDEDPLTVAAGHDPQLERGISELLKKLPPSPTGLPPRPPAPNKVPVR